ncbi:dTDP-4-dehydrorhamnose 3,5-epimerase [Desulfosarcina widdelii]|uniref:dTDP-4-dehydrorhamnose 3,5-epimerase n=1 Tax=Desulfosarcina widdelii TaxID=947919 RepID=A0A5K7ZD64_9BACT|nr:dTDP-4-dehydrorhamnose 3,5-epimerase [Desulfosarcina widdelii]BBO77671.1 dTDP-4-dehydrorhamnose 3,5-epimerase [Desulfosarcina widdelii]
MKFEKTEIAGVVVIKLEKIQDPRGYFARTFCRREFETHGLSTSLVQANTALSHHKGTLRGMHYQAAPHGEAKLVRCIRGAIFDAVVDLRPASPSYCRWFGVELTEDNGRMLYFPEGLAHGYQTLQDDSEVAYMVSQFYTPEAEKGVRWNDPRFNIVWPIVDGVLLSDKDRQWPDFTD